MTIKNDGAQTILLLEIIEQEDVEGWLYANVKFDYKNFLAKFTISLMLNDFYPFRDELIKLNSSLKGIANFSTIEQNVVLKLTGDGLGHINISGVLRHDSDLQLYFDILSDQTFLPSLIKECNDIIDQNQNH
ncbi:MAG: hypothetical protein ABI091_30485 [Ferruginibacter sp.]